MVFFIFPLFSLGQSEIFFLEKNLFYGSIDQNIQYRRNTIISNTGNEPLTLFVLKTSCGCLIPNYPKEPILPGELAKIQFVFLTANRFGAFTKSATLRCSDTSEIAYLWRLRGYITAEGQKRETIPAADQLNCDKQLVTDSLRFLPVITSDEGKSRFFLKMASQIPVDSAAKNHFIYDMDLLEDTIFLNIRYLEAGRCMPNPVMKHHEELLPIPHIIGKSFPIVIQYANRKLLLEYDIVNRKCVVLRMAEDGKASLLKTCVD